MLRFGVLFLQLLLAITFIVIPVSRIFGASSLQQVLSLGVPRWLIWVANVVELSGALLLLLAWYLYNRLSPDVPTVLAATCALTFAWMVVAPWQLPWYSSIAWVTLALLPRNSLTRWLTIATGALALMHFNGGQPTNQQTGPTP